jgi:hypothetical protein
MRHLRISKQQLDSLPEYSASYPTGVYLGKLWKALWSGQWFILGYTMSEDPARCKVTTWRPEIMLQDSAFIQACYLSYREEAGFRI